ncbi:hypothetical protein FB451DRAFT_1281441 [Mycena latifolia]|nr:hypothetical protein FB451DRAFT_1281441 [Mycena latifolia]
MSVDGASRRRTSGEDVGASRMYVGVSVPSSSKLHLQRARREWKRAPDRTRRMDTPPLASAEEAPRASASLLPPSPLIHRRLAPPRVPLRDDVERSTSQCRRTTRMTDDAGRSRAQDGRLGRRLRCRYMHTCMQVETRPTAEYGYGSVRRATDTAPPRSTPSLSFARRTTLAARPPAPRPASGRKLLAACVGSGRRGCDRVARPPSASLPALYRRHPAPHRSIRDARTCTCTHTVRCRPSTETHLRPSTSTAGGGCRRWTPYGPEHLDSRRLAPSRATAPCAPRAPRVSSPSCGRSADIKALPRQHRSDQVGPRTRRRIHTVASVPSQRVHTGPGPDALRRAACLQAQMHSKHAPRGAHL